MTMRYNARQTDGGQWLAVIADGRTGDAMSTVRCESAAQAEEAQSLAAKKGWLQFPREWKGEYVSAPKAEKAPAQEPKPAPAPAKKG